LETYRVVLYDSRGRGYSDRSADDFSIEAVTRALEGVVDAEGLDRSILAAFVDSVPTAVSYAARYPDRVTHLVLCDGWASATDFSQAAAWDTTMRLAGTDWKLFTEMWAQVLWGSEDSSYTNSPESPRV
jgi:pimeloyl-ACP methyl ester carboxylesterase